MVSLKSKNWSRRIALSSVLSFRSTWTTEWDPVLITTLIAVRTPNKRLREGSRLGFISVVVISILGGEKDLLQLTIQGCMPSLCPRKYGGNFAQPVTSHLQARAEKRRQADSLAVCALRIPAEVGNSTVCCRLGHPTSVTLIEMIPHRHTNAV